MQRKWVCTGLVALIAGGVGYAQLSGLLGWNSPEESATEAGSLLGLIRFFDAQPQATDTAG